MARRRSRRRASLLRWLARGLAALILLPLLGAAALYGWLRTGLPETTGTASLGGLRQTVTVLRDADGVPHIFAASDDDAYEALGFVHAQDRLFQMDFQRRLGAGRLAEVVGSSALPVDRTMRTLGLYRAAEASVASLAPEVRRALEAYARGVNGWLEQNRRALPPEYWALWTRPEPWRVTDSLVWGRLMAMTLSGNWRGEALRARLALRLSAEQLADWYADDDRAGPVTLPDLGDRAGLDDLLGRALAALPEAIRPRLASNVWAVDRRHTATGGALLANDPHLGFAAPGLWYLARITTPGLSLAGATVAGVPFHILGQNAAIAWGMTTTGADTQDLFVEQVVGPRGESYRTPDGPRPFAVRTETIKVRGGSDVSLRVRETRHGPVISDVEASLAPLAVEDRVIALASTALRPDDRSAEALWRLNRATDWDQFNTALAAFGAPVQNVAYADRGGRIGMVTPGLIPIRRSGDGFMPARGWDDSAAWDGFVPFDRMPRRVDPPAGRLVNANNRLVDATYPHFISRDWDAPWRAGRIEALLAGATGQTVETQAAIQADSLSPMAETLLPLMLARVPDSPRTAAAVARLAAWDRRMDRERAEPLIFVAWLRELDRALFADELGDLFGAMWDLHGTRIARVLRTEAAWCDDVGTPTAESCADQVALALDRALTRLGERFGPDPAAWRWGEAHRARHDHPIFGRVPLLRDLADIVVAADGGNDTVNRAAMRIGNEADPFADVHGAGYRAIYDLADPARSRFVIATGQSGNPLSPHYRDFTQRWRDGTDRPLTGTPAALTAAGAQLLTLQPR